MQLYLRGILLGLGLAMDACAVSMANGLKEPKMFIKKILFIAFLFGFFQAMMPLVGYFIGHAFLSIIEKYIPWIALILLCVLGGNMIFEAFKKDNNEPKGDYLTFKVLLVQALATSIDALSVGFTFADYTVNEALITAVIIAIVTFGLSTTGVFIGKKFGTKLGKKAEILGGIILIGIGLEIFISNLIG